MYRFSLKSVAVGIPEPPRGSPKRRFQRSWDAVNRSSVVSSGNLRLDIVELLDIVHLSGLSLAQLIADFEGRL